MAKLPEWLLKELPEPKYPAFLKYENEQYVAISPEGKIATFETVDEAYDHIQNSWNLEVDFDESLPERNGRREQTIWVSGKRTSKGVRILISSTDFDKLKELEDDYADFLKLANEYKNNPNDFQTVYRFVDTHPAFWNRYSSDHPWDWMTYGHCALHDGRLTAEPIFNEDGSYRWVIETGSHVEPEYKERYHDYKLDSRGKTIEEAYINLAKNIVKFYNNDGTQKEDVPHEKPEWVVEIEKSFEESEV